MILIDRQLSESFFIVVHNGRLPARLNMELLRLLQQQEATTFTPRVAYDGQKIIFSTRQFLGQNNSQKVMSFGVDPISLCLLCCAVYRQSSSIQRSTESIRNHCDEDFGNKFRVSFKICFSKFYPILSF